MESYSFCRENMLPYAQRARLECLFRRPRAFGTCFAPLSPAVGLLVPLLLHMLSMLLTHHLPRIRAIHPSVCTGVLRLCLCRGGLKVSSAFHIYPGICYAYFEGYSETAMIGLPNAGIPAWLEGSRRLTGALPTHVYAPSYATHVNSGFCFFPS